MGENNNGMVPTGKWTHKITGHEIMVRDCFQDGDHVIIMTNEGQLNMQDFSQNYIQLEEGEIIPNLSDLYGNGLNSSLLAQINRGIDKEDQVGLVTTNINDNKSNVIIENVNNDNDILLKGLGTSKEVKNNKNYTLIKKVFDKFPVERSIEFEIFKDEWPIKEFSMLVNVLDVPLQDICEYIIENYMSKEKLAKYLASYFEEYI